MDPVTTDEDLTPASSPSTTQSQIPGANDFAFVINKNNAMAHSNLYFSRLSLINIQTIFQSLLMPDLGIFENLLDFIDLYKYRELMEALSLINRSIDLTQDAEDRHIQLTNFFNKIFVKITTDKDTYINTQDNTIFYWNLYFFILEQAKKLNLNSVIQDHISVISPLLTQRYNTSELYSNILLDNTDKVAFIFNEPILKSVLSNFVKPNKLAIRSIIKFLPIITLALQNDRELCQIFSVNNYRVIRANEQLISSGKLNYSWPNLNFNFTSLIIMVQSIRLSLSDDLKDNHECSGIKKNSKRTSVFNVFMNHYLGYDSCQIENLIVEDSMTRMTIESQVSLSTINSIYKTPEKINNKRKLNNQTQSPVKKQSIFCNRLIEKENYLPSDVSGTPDPNQSSASIINDRVRPANLDFS